MVFVAFWPVPHSSGGGTVRPDQAQSCENSAFSIKSHLASYSTRTSIGTALKLNAWVQD